MNTLSLNGSWKFKAIDHYKRLPREHHKVLRWMNGYVPGTVHTDLLAEGIIDDPFYRMNENAVQWIESQQWLYARDFTINPKFLKCDQVHLVAEGLDTYAKIWINGRSVGKTSNMFVEHRFEVKKYLRGGRNRMEILFDSPTIHARNLERRHGALQVALEPHRVYIRKAQYSFGWDWGPKLTTSGIWRGISLKSLTGGRLLNPFVKVLSIARNSALVEVSVAVERYNDHPYTVRTNLAGEKWCAELDTIVKGRTVKFRARITNPELWWPNGYGKQPMYRALFTLLQDGKVLHQVESPFALRSIELVQQPDIEGRSFLFKVNGIKIYCKGADWIPGDSFLPRMNGEKYETLLRRARDAHMNMIRVWGGGIYEDDCFYALCDRLGLMVWQDFMFACGEYPEEKSFLKAVRDEAEFVVTRLRNHPSIVIWCGNNECEWLYCMQHPNKIPDHMRGSKIFRDLLPQVCKFLDGTRPYWRSSPFGHGFPNAETNGNHHQWAVWSSWKDYPEYEHDRGRFVTEFGFQAPPNKRTFDEITIAADRYPQSRVIEHHNKQVEGTERLLRFQAAHFRLSNTFSGFIYQGQVVQADALKCAAEHWRRRKFRTAGSLFWQLNDCWPVSSWSIIDSALRPKAAYFAAKRFFNPLSLSFKKVSSGIECWVTNDRLAPVHLSLALRILSFSGKQLWRKSLEIKVPQNRSVRVCYVKSDVYDIYDPSSVYLVGTLTRRGDIISENRIFFAEPKHWHKREGRIRLRVRRIGPGAFAVTIGSPVFLKAVCLDMDGEDVFFDDNYFDLDGGGSKTVTFESLYRLREVRKRIGACWI